MIHANARMQVDLMFAALLILVAISLSLYFSIDWLLRRFYLARLIFMTQGDKNEENHMLFQSFNWTHRQFYQFSKREN